MNRTTPILLLLVLGLAIALRRLRSSQDDRTDDERIVGSWTASQASVDVSTPLGTVPVPVLNESSMGSVTIAFDADGTFSFRVVGPLSADFFGQTVDILEDGVDETTSGTYSVQSDGQIRFGVDWHVRFGSRRRVRLQRRRRVRPLGGEHRRRARDPRLPARATVSLRKCSTPSVAGPSRSAAIPNSLSRLT